MNLEFDRQLRSFSIPTAGGSQVQNTSFRDGDSDPANDWTPVVLASSISWLAPPGQGLPWGTLVGFAFDAQVPAVATASQLAVLDPGTPTSIAIETLGPPPPPIPTLPLAGLVVLALGTLTVLAVAVHRRRARP